MVISRGFFNACLLFVILLTFSGCSFTTTEIKRAEPDGILLNFTNISSGLPQEGLWRENIELFDTNGDGYFDIVAPPPRKATGDQKRPFIFLWESREAKWHEGRYDFPVIKDINYGGIAVGDINRDNYFDLVVASHSGSIVVLLNNQKGGFIEQPLPIKEPYHSRAVRLADINNDGWLDIVAVSEGAFVKDYIPKGILIALNKEAKGWDIELLKSSMKIFSDSITVADINLDARKDILIAPLTSKKEDKKAVWLQDKGGDFSFYPTDIFAEAIPFTVRSGDFDGDGQAEIAFFVSGLGDAGVWLSFFKWDGDTLKEIASGLKIEERTLVFDLFDIDKDGRDELIALTVKGFRVFKYSQSGWNLIGYYPLAEEDVKGASDLKINRQKDDSLIFVYTLGSEMAGLNKGIRAYMLK